ncbi:1-aminocyclopropane-1-carboxylate deaminase/D-cysteine desulfhydrase [Mongoliibacter ruber]|uniref:1-aminocyclopropane-1-carboxylate deaminase/D-cysteine desulfhydrase-like pyridoxal-dependent ACC family enzyme n=1 Tax=Mongoliibacter ruber TaxID=1750599 RepID=A0A2T0WGV4_9BACT|nr:pyridoxal-phosphate dependent enzyme [Mongoliibacter ruber]PRY85902.1 1-aminocyclopropane-1-carboxylate deaminase/D-cysteine desulfhydrase-like pyridoxal-dependent ACC family enzyme [Mongoliibacter ruber]
MLLPTQIATQELHAELLSAFDLRLFIRRLDQIHPLVSGNKFFKLKYNLFQAKNEGKNRLLTFGGAFSNHIHALSAAAKEEGFQAIGVIRGEEIFPLNPTLGFAQQNGMILHFVDRSSFRDKNKPEFINELRRHFGDFYLIPEGGTNSLAIEGTAEILKKADDIFTHIACSIGTGGTISGLAQSMNKGQHLLGFSSLKGDFIHQEIKELLIREGIVPKGEFTILDSYHFGGYGKFKPELIKFLKEFYGQFQIPLDPVYTGKMMYGLFDLIQKNYFPRGSRILCMHTGGLQGVAGFNQRFGEDLPSK